MEELRALLNVILSVFSKPKVYIYIYGIKRMHPKRARIKRSEDEKPDTNRPGIKRSGTYVPRAYQNHGKII